MHDFEIKPNLEKKLIKVCRKNKILYEEIMRKIDEIIHSDSAHYKNLRYDLKTFKRVHISHFVLVFSYEKNKVSFQDFDHHDNIYKN